MAKKKRGDRKKGGNPSSGGSSMRTFYIVLAVVAVVGVVSVASALGSRALGDTATAPVELEGLDDPQSLVRMAQGVTLGDPDAPITIVEFADYQCPACATFASFVKPQVQAAVVESGDAKLVFYDFPLVSIHPNAFLAARAGRCAEDQDAFWTYHDRLFANQSAWSGQSDPAGAFVDYAGEVGMDEGTFEECIRSDRHADLVTANMRLAEQLNISGTPTIMITEGQGMARRIQLGSDPVSAIVGAVEQIQESRGAEAEPGS